MNTDQFSFFNQQLAAALRAGVPLEGALRQLARTLRRGRLRHEIERLEADLASGLPLEQALEGRRFPDLYVQVLKVAARSNDLPGFLTLLADYYRSAFEIGSRLRALLVYPVIVLLGSCGLSIWFALVADTLAPEPAVPLASVDERPRFRTRTVPRIAVGSLPELRAPAIVVRDPFARSQAAIWAPPLCLLLVLGLAVAIAVLPRARGFLRWHAPAFREAALSQFACVLGLLTRSGVALPEGLRLVCRVESSAAMRAELGRWLARLEAGHGRFEHLAAESRMVPPLFVWLVNSGGEDLAAGFFRAAEVYERRASLRTEALLHAALPAALLLLGLLILSQIHPFTTSVFEAIFDLGQFG